MRLSPAYAVRKTLPFVALFVALAAPAVAAPETEKAAPVDPEAKAVSEVTSPSPAVPEISLVIVGPGEDVYSLYGHAALMVREPGKTADQAVVYNFGVTGFDQEGYVQLFLTGRVQFWGNARPYARLLEGWRRWDRTVVRYPLNLAPAAALGLAARVRHDVQPEHKHFIYDTFRANCATKLRDLLDTYTGGAVFAALGHADSGRTFREDVRVAYAGHPWLLLLTEVVPGVELDAQRTEWALGYLPAHLERGLLKVTLPDGRPLLGDLIIDHSRAASDPRDGWPHIGQAILVFLAALLGVFAFFAPRLGPRPRGSLLALGALGTTLFSLLLLVVNGTTDWPDMQRNWLLLAVLPTDAFLVWPGVRLAIWRAEPGQLARRYLFFRLGLAGGLVVLTPLALAGPWPPRLVALVGLFAALRLLGKRPEIKETSPERLYTKRTGEYPALSRARKRRTM